MNTPDRKKMMNEPLENTPQSEKKRQREGMLAQNTSHRDLSEDFKGSTEEDDSKPTIDMNKSRILIQQVEKLSPPQQPTQSQKDLQAINEGIEKEGGGILEMFGLAGGRKRRRKKSRKKKIKSKRNKRMARKSRRRSRSRRGGITCKGYKGIEKGPECPCPPEPGKKPSVPMMAIGKAAEAKKKAAKAALLEWKKRNAKYQACMGQQHNAVYWKKWQLKNEGKLKDWDAQRKEYVASIEGTGVTGSEHNQQEREKAGIDAYDDPSAADTHGGRRRKSRRKKRRKSRRKRRKRTKKKRKRKSRRRRSRRRRR